jgi:hypothetical protein
MKHPDKIIFFFAFIILNASAFSQQIPYGNNPCNLGIDKTIFKLDNLC